MKHNYKRYRRVERIIAAVIVIVWLAALLCCVRKAKIAAEADSAATTAKTIITA